MVNEFYDNLKMALNKILEVLKKYSFVFEDRKTPFEFFSCIPIQDECAYIGVIKRGDEFSYTFQGSYFDFLKGDMRNGTVENAAKRFEELKVPPQNILKSFIHSLSKAIGEHSTTQKLSELEVELGTNS